MLDGQEMVCETEQQWFIPNRQDMLCGMEHQWFMPEGQLEGSEGQPEGSEDQPEGSEGQPAGSEDQPGGVGRCTYIHIEFLTILQYFIPSWGHCPTTL